MLIVLDANDVLNQGEKEFILEFVANQPRYFEFY